MKPSYYIRKTTLGIALAMLLSFPLTSDASLFSWRGNEAGMDNRFPLAGTAEQSGTWAADDMTIDYQYSLTGNMLHLSGKIDVQQYLSEDFAVFRYLFVAIHFLDGDNRVMSRRQEIFYLLSKPIFGKQSFSKRLVLPPGAKAMAFSYTGWAHQQGGGALSVWQTPMR